jgi:hypothetical protein
LFAQPLNRSSTPLFEISSIDTIARPVMACDDAADGEAHGVCPSVMVRRGSFAGRRCESELAASVWSVQDEKETDRSTLRRYSIGGDDDAIE